MNTFLILTNPEKYDVESVKDRGGMWSCQSKTKIGDRLYVYLTGGNGISYEWKASTDARKDPKWTYACDVEFVREITPSIKLDILKKTIPKTIWPLIHSVLGGHKSIEIPEKAVSKIDSLISKDSKKRNPPWARDELILALDLYFSKPEARGSKTHPDVINLSNMLNQLPIHGARKTCESFRNPNGVGMKLSNFLRYDPEYKGKGLSAGSKLEEGIWNEFSGKREKLTTIARAIRENYKEIGYEGSSREEEISDEEEAEEGSVLTKVHKSRERNAKLVNKKKKKVLQETGCLSCEACGFDFLEFYGDRGNGFAECHHEKPVSELKPNDKTKISELKIVCSNCHRIIHRKRPWLSVDELTKLIRK